MEIHLAGSRPTRRAPKEYFTGTVWQDPIITAAAPARVVANRVAFEPGARTAWHTHPLGQTLYVVFGVGRVQAKGGPVREIKSGDVVWIPPGEKHWHGAGPTTAHGSRRHAGSVGWKRGDLDGICDRRRIRRGGGLVPRSPDAAQRAAFRRGALLIRGPDHFDGRAGPGSAARRKGRRTASGTRISF